jgi:hypothetical protein
MVDRLGIDLTGRFLDDVLGTKYSSYLVALDGEVFERKHAIYSETLIRAVEGHTLITRRMLVPLAHFGREPAIILGAQTYHGEADAPRHSLLLTDRCEIEELSRRVLE